MNKTHCDNPGCERTRPTDNEDLRAVDLGWRELTYISHHATINTPVQTRHFCSLLCCAQWAVLGTDATIVVPIKDKARQ